MSPRMLNAISLAEKVLQPLASMPSATEPVALMRPVPRVQPGGREVSDTKKKSKRRDAPMTAPAMQRYSPQLSELQRLKSVSSEILLSL